MFKRMPIKLHWSSGCGEVGGDRGGGWAAGMGWPKPMSTPVCLAPGCGWCWGWGVLRREGHTPPFHLLWRLGGKDGTRTQDGCGGVHPHGPPCGPAQAQGSHCSQRGEAPSPEAHSRPKTQESEGPRSSARPTLAQSSEPGRTLQSGWLGSLPPSVQGRPLLAAQRVHLSSFQGDLASPHGSVPGSASCRSQCHLLRGLAASLSLGTQADRRPVIALVTHPFVLLAGRLWLWQVPCPCEPGCRPRVQQRPPPPAGFILVCALHLGERT